MGKRAVVLCTEPFVVTARNIARLLGLPDYPFLKVQHPIGSCTLGSLTATSCTFSTAALTVGNHSLTAYYNGDANRAPSLSAVRTQTVNTVTTTTTLTSSANPVAYGTAITFTAVVSTASATGTQKASAIADDSAPSAIFEAMPTPNHMIMTGKKMMRGVGAM